MECYEGATMIKTFRGQIADTAQDTIVLHTNDGSVGYRITKLELMSLTPGVAEGEHIIQIFTTSHTDTNLYDNVNFSDQTLIACGWYRTHTSEIYTDTHRVIFDHVVFNQDIFITHADVKGSLAVNYYIELEQIKLDLNESTVATLKDIRNKELRTMIA